MYPRQCAESVDHASRASRRLNAVGSSLTLYPAFRPAPICAMALFPVWVFRPGAIAQLPDSVIREESGRSASTTWQPVNMDRGRQVGAIIAQEKKVNLTRMKDMMAIPPEVTFDRFLRDQTEYKDGKQDLDRIDSPEIRSLVDRDSTNPQFGATQ